MKKHISTLLVLVALKKLGEAPASTIQKEANIGNYYTVKTILNELKKKNIVEERYDPGPPGKFIFRLTDKGKKVAELAEQLLNILEE